ncbi:MAG: transposase [Lentisphaeria bacterium]
MDILEKLLDELLKDYKNHEDLLDKNGIMQKLKKRLIERAMEAEMNDHLGYKKHVPEGRNSGNSRNGYSTKKVISDETQLEIAVPRDRPGNFEPQIIPKNQRGFDGFDDKIISMYVYGMTTRDIQYHLKDIYNVDVSPTLISEVTDAIIHDVRSWQSRPLDPVYLILFLDCIAVKCREDKQIRNKSVPLALVDKKNCLACRLRAMRELNSGCML